jgi:hypothetical protein
MPGWKERSINAVTPVKPANLRCAPCGHAARGPPLPLSRAQPLARSQHLPSHDQLVHDQLVLCVVE